MSGQKDLQPCNYVFEDDMEKAKITIPVPSDICGSNMQVLFDAPSKLTVHVPGRLPFVAGILFSPVKEPVVIRGKEKVEITLFKEEQGEWPVLMNPQQSPEEIDPKSSYDIAVALSNLNDGSGAEPFFARAADCGYEPMQAENDMGPQVDIASPEPPKKEKDSIIKTAAAIGASVTAGLIGLLLFRKLRHH